MIGPQEVQAFTSLIKTMDKQTMWIIFIGGGGIGYLFLKLALGFLLKWKGKQNGGDPKQLKMACIDNPHAVLAIDRNKRVEDNTDEIKTCMTKLVTIQEITSRTMESQQHTMEEFVRFTKIYLDRDDKGHY
jgi:hypothetical protein